MTHLAKLSQSYREEGREELSSAYRYFWRPQQPLGDKGDPSTCQQDTDSSPIAWKADSPHPTHRQAITTQAVQALPWLAFILLQKPL